jgi:anti-sigma factor RsiW
MNPTVCADVADRLPNWVAGRLPADQAARVAEHVGSCADCASQAATVHAVLAARAPVPADLAARTLAALRAAEAEPRAVPRRRTRRWTSWVGSAAAVLVLAVGTFVLRQGDPGEVDDLGPAVVDESVWITDDGIVAGAPVLDDLSDDALATLLEEMGG